LLQVCGIMVGDCGVINSKLDYSTRDDEETQSCFRRYSQAVGRELVCQNIQLFHLGELICWDDFILVSIHVLPVDVKWEGLDNGGQANDHIVFCAERVTRKGMGGSFKSLVQLLDKALIVGGCSDPWASPRKGCVHIWQRGVDARAVKREESLEKNEQGEMAEPLGSKRVGIPSEGGAGTVPEDLIGSSDNPADGAYMFESSTIGT
jgi:hypothetical protein